MGKFKNLWVWSEGINFAAEIYEITKKGEFAKDYGLKNQIQRAVVSISSNIAEGEERDSDRQTAHFLKIAKASNAEVYTQLQIAHRIGYIDAETLRNLEGKSNMIGTGLYKLIKRKGGYNLGQSLKWLILGFFIPV